MLQLFQTAVIHQFQAAFAMLDRCVDHCPASQWESPVVNLKFCQVAFHALFFTDVYLGVDLKSLREQSFHREHPELFADYEELEDRPQQQIYSKDDAKMYLQHCRDKAEAVIGGETEASLAMTPGFDWLEFSRAEVHLYNLRHLNHHIAQLSMRLRMGTGDGVAWVKSDSK